VRIEEASRLGEIIVYKDKRIRYRPEERAAFVRAGARMFLLGGNLSRFEMLASCWSLGRRGDSAVHLPHRVAWRPLAGVPSANRSHLKRRAIRDAMATSW
jgi:hypothetical protein